MSIESKSVAEWSEIAAFHGWMLQRNSESATAGHYRDDVRGLCRFVQKPLGDVGPREIDGYIAHCQNERGHSGHTIRRRLAAIKRFYDFVIDYEIASVKNPVRKRRHYVKVGERLPRDISDRELKGLLKVIKKARDKAMLLLMVQCGLRISEVIHLKLSQVQLNPEPGQLPRLRVIGKGNKERVVPLSQTCVQWLRRWLKERPTCESDTVFVNRYGRRFFKTGIYWNLKRYCEAAGIRCTPHQLRHTFGRLLVEAGMPITSVRELMGHASIQTTQGYVRLSNNIVQAEYKAAMVHIAERMRGAL